MALQQFCIATCLSLAIITGLGTSAKADNLPWKQYADPHHRFLLQYPDTTESETVTDRETGLLSRVAFPFEQAFRQGADAGSLKFRFQISVWQNTNHLSAEAWARQNIKPELTLETRSIQLAGRKGVTVKTTNMAWSIVKSFVADKDCLYELSYTDVAANKLLLSEETRSRWAALFARMLESFRILPGEGESK